MEQQDLFTAEALRGATGPEEVTRLRVLASSCTACSLHKERTQVVFGEGATTRAAVAFVGESPSSACDLEGHPFCGEPGKLLDGMLTAMKLTRKKVYLCNVVGCRPPAQRKPEEDEQSACRSFFAGQLRAVEPLVIVAMGTTASQALLPVGKGVTRLRDAWHMWEDIPVRVTFHPAYLLRHPEAKPQAWADLKAVMARLGL